VAQSLRAGYNPHPLPQRPFHDDYPRIPRSDEAGRLAESIEGRQLHAPFVAGRRVFGGGDEGLRGGDVAKAAVGLVDRVAPASARGLRGAAGKYERTANLEAGRPERVISYRDSLPVADQPTVIAHELGHAIDDLAGRIPQDGLRRELEQVYSDLATGRQGVAAHKTLPQHVGYRGDAADAELMAEAVRAYMVDPNYLKTVAPKTAARIRQYANDNPLISRVIQFNQMAPLAAPLGVGAAMSQEDSQAGLGAMTPEAIGRALKRRAAE